MRSGVLIRPGAQEREEGEGIQKAELGKFNLEEAKAIPIVADGQGQVNHARTSVQNNQALAQTQAFSQAQSAQKQANLQNTVPQDKATISAEAQAKQTAASIGAVQDHRVK